MQDIYTTQNATEAGTLIIHGIRPIDIKKDIYIFEHKDKCKEVLRKFYFGGNE